ncbi:MAG: hypothetical protein O3A46_14750, partial [Candidatus Poribacteria bacterium]|nr:hypothetical protein [Candidatus Poribacteria bacterium]
MPDPTHIPLLGSGDGRFYTDSLYLAAFLVAHGVRVESAETDAWGRHRFGLRDAPERERLVRRV